MAAKLILDIIIGREGDLEVASLKGPIDSSTLDLFQEKVGGICGRPGGRVLLDCRELTYINSRGIGLLMKFHRSLTVTRGQLALCSLIPKLARTLDLLQIGRALNIYPSREDALAAMGKA